MYFANNQKEKVNMYVLMLILPSFKNNNYRNLKL